MNLRSLFSCIALVVYTLYMNAQTGIGTTTPHASAKLEVNATNKGFLPPRVTLTSGVDATTIPSPATGLLVYNTGNNAGLVAGYYYWNGTSWATIATASGSGVSASYLSGSRSSGQTTGLSNGGTVVFTQVDNVAGQDISLNTGTGQITLAAGRTYRLTAQVPNFQTTSGETRLQLAWYNETTGAYIGSSTSTYPPSSGAAYGVTGGLSAAIITTTTTTVVSYRFIQISNANQIGGNADFSATGSYPWFDVEVISGNQPAMPDRIAKFVDAGTFVALENIKATVTTSGNRGLSVAAVSTPFYCNIGATFGNSAGSGGSAVYNNYVTTTASGSWFGWHFTNAGDFITYLVNDTTNNRVYRITLSIGAGYANNFISIERLF